MLVAVALVVSSGFALSLGAPVAPGSADSQAQPSASSGITILPLGGATPIPSTFWGINVDAGYPFTVSNAKLLATTPVTWIRYPGGATADELNYTSGTIWNKTGVAHPAATTPAEFVAACEAINCHAIMALPAEIDSPSTAAYYVEYVEDTLGFTPAYWSVGNEPTTWHHWDQPWNTWATSAQVLVTVPAYLPMLHDYITAIRSVDPTTPIIAPSIGGGSALNNTCSSWCGPVAAADGSALAALSVHSYTAYPPPGIGQRTVESFFATLQTSPYALPTVIPRDRAIIAQNYSGNLPLYLDEITTVPFVTGGESTYATYTSELYGGLFDAAQTTQLLALQVPDVDWFDWGGAIYGWDNSTTGSLTPTGEVFQSFMSQLYGAYDPTTVNGPSTVYAAATTDGTNLSLLVVNVATTGSYSFPLSTLFSGTVSETSLAVGTSITTSQVANTTGTAPPLSVTIWRGYAVGHSPPPPHLTVTVTPNPGSVTVDGTQAFLATASCNSGQCPPGVTYSWSLSNPLGKLNSTSGPQVLFSSGGAPGDDTLFVNASVDGVTRQSAPDPITIVSAPPQTYSVTFTESGLPSGTPWSVSLNGTGGSSMVSSIGFTEPNGTYPYSVTPVPGYSAAPDSGTLTVSGLAATEPIAFTAIPPASYPVTFEETGLALGTPWSVSLNGSTGSAINSSIAFAEPNGTYPYSVGPVPGYSAAPSSGTLAVGGMAVTEPIAFTAIPPASYPVTFEETGLTVGTSWSIAIGGSVHSSEGSTITLVEPNGTFNYSVGNVSGYSAAPTSASLTVLGAAASANITFTMLPSSRFPVTFTESGLLPGTSWSVTVGATIHSSTTGSLSFSETNGSYSYSVGYIAGYGSSPDDGSITVNAAAVSVGVAFAPVYPTTFTESTLTAGTNWSVTLTGGASTLILLSVEVGGSTSQTQWSDGTGQVVFFVSDGSYSYSVAAPGHPNATGQLTVSGTAPAPVTVSFPSGSAASSGIPALDYAILGVVAGILVIAMVAVLLRRRTPPRAVRVQPPSDVAGPPSEAVEPPSDPVEPLSLPEEDADSLTPW
ncbi:MAG: hypothetical protein WB873_03565 [Thermoplasmata archaeon]